ncbi:hypothetical protein GPECTOR_32g430 [Gonium pectorale]|uniref:Uncharacterized protein n=1 Tax=Gonium pectorale TaxID=33097 RepID=A0A150GDD2_GONPE|nr:hypothetical protein GPECTOR_32g430 [Gonium pectorale]|eukprot:KXZ47818.1 hypothetical protein GPECTOR_32g430 [Gonium pectorale]
MQSDPISAYLLQDPSFAAAVKKQDVGQAALTAAKIIKLNLHAIIARIKPQQSAAMAGLLPGGAGGSTAPHPYSQQLPGTPGALAAAAAGGSERRLSDPDGRYRRGGSCEPMDGQGMSPRSVRRGDWVVIRGTNKSTDPELLGQDAWVARVETNGWVEVHVPKLGRTVKLQQRYLHPLPPQIPPTLGPGVTAGPPGGMVAPLGMGPAPGMGLPPPPGARRMASEAGVSSAGMMGPPATTPYVDELGRPYKRPALDPAVRPALSPEALPPARVANTPSRSSSSRVKDLIRAIRRDLLAVEESIPWNCVSPTWKNARPGWRRSLQRSVDSPAPAAAASAPGAAAAATSPGPPTPSASAGAAAPATAGAGGGAFGSGDSAAAAAVAALVGATAASMLELHDALTTEKSHGLFARRGAWETRLRELADGGNNHHCLQVLWAEMSEGIKVWLAGPSPEAVGQPYRPYEPGSQPFGAKAPRDSFADDGYLAAAATSGPPPPPLHVAAAGNGQALASPFFDFAATAVGGPTGGRAGAPPISPWVVRSELTLMMQSIEDEVDTDCDEGPDATDVEDNDDDSDAERGARARARARARRRAAEQPQPAPPAAVTGPETATAAATAATAGTAPGAAGAGDARGEVGKAETGEASAGNTGLEAEAGIEAGAGPSPMDVDPAPLASGEGAKGDNKAAVVAAPEGATVPVADAAAAGELKIGGQGTGAAPGCGDAMDCGEPGTATTEVAAVKAPEPGLEPPAAASASDPPEPAPATGTSGAKS